MATWNASNLRSSFAQLDATSTLLGNQTLGWIIVAITGLILVIGPKARTQWTVSRFPLLGKELGSEAKRKQMFWLNAKDLYAEAYRTFRDRVCRITTTEGAERILLWNNFVFIS